jgi:predicted anti-sigma-YlaC factor YlaD
MNGHEHRFDEALISGYLDGELTQGDEQRVRLHLQSCAECSRIADELRRVAEATRTTAFQVPDDTQWDETPRNRVSRVLQHLAWLLAIVWVAGLVAFLIWQAATGGDSVRFEALLGVLPLVAVGLIVLSALTDRLQTRKTDPYRKVQK